MRLVSVLLIIVFVFIAHDVVFSQSTVSGTVVGERSAEPMIGASVYIEGTNQGTTVQLEGDFVLNIEEPVTIVISYVGYVLVKLDVEPGDHVDVVLVESGTIISCPMIFAEKYRKPHAYSIVELNQVDINKKLQVQNLYNEIPDVYMHSGAFNTNRLTMRGIGSRSAFATSRIRVFFNDIPITDGRNETNLEDINLNIVDQIEVYGGPTRPFYGAGLGGVIRYKSVPAARKEGVYLDGGIGSFANRSLSLGLNKQVGKTAMSANFTRIGSDGYRSNNEMGRRNISFFSTTELKKSQINVFVNDVRLQGEIPSSLSENSYRLTPSKAANNWAAIKGNENYARQQLGLNYTRKISSNVSNSSSIAYQRFRNSERRPFNSIEQDRFSFSFRNVSTMDYWRNQAKLSAGVEIFRELELLSTFETGDEGKGMQIGDLEQLNRYANFFIDNEVFIKNVRITTGLNFNVSQAQHTDDFNGTPRTIYAPKPIVSPFLSASYEKGGAIDYVTISHGFSQASLEETLDENGVVNNSIRPETGLNFEYGGRRTLGRNSVEYNIYYMYVRNLLVARRITEDQTIGVNAGITGHTGLSIAYERLIYSTRSRTWKSKIMYQFAPHHFIDFAEEEVDYSGKLLPGNPVHRGLFNVLYQEDNFSLGVDNHIVGAQFADDANALLVPAYWLCNVNLSWTVYEENSWRLDLSGFINNIFNTPYASMVSVNPQSFNNASPRYLYPGLPFNIFFSAKLSKAL